MPDPKTQEDRTIHEKMFRELSDKGVFEQAKAYAVEYMDAVGGRSVFPEQGAVDALQVFDEPLPEDPSPGSEVIATLRDFGSPATVAQTGGAVLRLRERERGSHGPCGQLACRGMGPERGSRRDVPHRRQTRVGL